MPMSPSDAVFLCGSGCPLQYHTLSTSVVLRALGKSFGMLLSRAGQQAVRAVWRFRQCPAERSYQLNVPVRGSSAGLGRYNVLQCSQR